MTVNPTQEDMDFMNIIKKTAWCKPDWSSPPLTKEVNELLEQCADLPKVDVSDDIDDVIERSKAFPIPFPIKTVRLAHLKETRPLDRLKKNIASTYPLLHERVLKLLSQFLVFKREFGSIIEKALYRDMTVPGLIDRILQKRAIMFMGRRDQYMLRNGVTGNGNWESIGTSTEKPPLILANYLSYDEVKLSAMVYVSGYTECINDGSRRNRGVEQEDGVQQNAVIIGIIGPRFQRAGRMDYEDMVVTEEQNSPQNGYGDITANRNQAKHMYRKMWADFYDVPNFKYEDMKSDMKTDDKSAEQLYSDRYVYVPKVKGIVDNEVYYKRLCIIAETVLHETEARAVGAGKDAFLNIIGAGLGVWKISGHQTDVFLLAFLERISVFLEKGLLHHVSDVTFAYIKPTCSSILNIFKEKINNKKTKKKILKTFIENKNHPRGGINVSLENREPSTKLSGEHEHKLLVLTYAWDGNAHPGNEFWKGSLHSSGDPAAACSTQVSELHNAHVNPSVVAHSTRVAATATLHTLHDYCRQVNT